MGAWGQGNFFLKSFPAPENLHLRQPPTVFRKYPYEKERNVTFFLQNFRKVFTYSSGKPIDNLWKM